MILRAFVLAGLTSASVIALAGAESSPDFRTEIAPLLEQRCAQCHGEKQQLSGLDLSSRAAMISGGKKGPAVLPGNPQQSPLYRHVAGMEEPAMPLGGALSAEEVALLRRWIAGGAEWEEAEAGRSGEKETWWSFIPPKRTEPPAGADHPVDAFVLARLREAGLSQAPRADKPTLLRRAYLDLTGLPPEPEALDRFLADKSEDAFEKVVDELLGSSAYGERWGRHWLDVVRYADSSGYEHDYDYPNAWRFRDYVIDSFNKDKPFDRFIEEQLAGDELADGSFETLVATGLHRIGPRVLYREKDNPQYRYEYLDDMVAVTSRAFLGLTVDCARCHDHKFDPIRQMDYYRMSAVFFPYIRYEFPLVSDEEIARHEAATAAIEKRLAPIKKELAAVESPYVKLKKAEKLKTFPQEIQDAVATPEAERTPGQRLLAAQVRTVGGGAIDGLLSDEDRLRIKALRAQIAEVERDRPAPLPTAMGIRDGDYRFSPDGLGDQVQPGKGNREDFSNVEGSWLPAKGYRPPQAHLLPNADYRNKAEAVEPGYIEAAAGGRGFEPAPPTHRISTGRRLGLARWIASEENPLTARVAVNRIWMHHFGEGLVTTAGNFGRLGTKPSHPKLLDWLATEFVRQGWSVKAMHRLLMSSATYQAASTHGDEQSQETDPDNRLLWRFKQRRLEAEAIRDAALFAAGRLNRQAGGPGFFPTVPQEVRDSFLKGKWLMEEPEDALRRRSVYAYVKRGLRYPMFEVFDAPNVNVVCERRNTTTVPTQALTLLNNRFTLEQARGFAERVAREADTESERIRRVYRIALGRMPTASEITANQAFLERQTAYHQGDSSAQSAELDALTDLCDVILNLNEFVYIQ